MAIHTVKTGLTSASSHPARRLAALLFWLAWCALWLPLLTFAAWTLGFYRARNVFGAERELQELGHLGLAYAGVFEIFGVALLVWALFMRLNEKQRDVAQPHCATAVPATDDVTAQAAHLDGQAIARACPGVLRRIPA